MATLEDRYKPTDLRIYLTLKTRPIHNNFTRYLTFSNLAAREKSGVVAFTKSSRLVYEGHVTAVVVVTLQTLAGHNNHPSWDTMDFENHGGSASLNNENFTAPVQCPRFGHLTPVLELSFTENPSCCHD